MEESWVDLRPNEVIKNINHNKCWRALISSTDKLF